MARIALALTVLFILLFCVAAIGLRAIQSRHAHTRFQRLEVVGDVSALSSNVPVIAARLLPRSAKDLEVAMDYDTQQFLIAFSYSEEDDETIAQYYTEVPDSQLGAVWCCGPIHYSRWPDELKGPVKSEGLKRANLTLLRRTLPELGSRENDVFLAYDATARAGYLYHYFH